MPNQRSLSTSAAQERNVGAKGLPYMKSEGSIAHDDDYSQPPMDSDPDHSIVSGSSYGHSEGGGAGRRHSLDRGRQPYNPHQHHQHHQQPCPQQSRHPGMINGALASSDQFVNFGPMGEGPVPSSMQSYPVPSNRAGGGDRKRESLYSETSTEFSASSNSGDQMPQSARLGGVGGMDKNRKTSVLSESETEFSVSPNYTEKESSPGKFSLCSLVGQGLKT